MPAATAPPDTGGTSVPHASLAAPGARSPGAALGIGLAATFAPVLLAVAVSSPSTTAGVVGLSAGAGAGILAGPAVGLWSGGRGDCATRGLVVRAIGAVGIAAGAYGLALALGEGGSNTSAGPLMIMGAASGIITTASVIHDLAITPSATARGRSHRTGLVIRPDGHFALCVRF
jgi:hypothetical protein